MKPPKKEKKRHHFVPVAYLQRFVNERGMVAAIRKDAPNVVTWSKPAEVALRRYYYSQPVGDGTQNNDALENVFSEFEAQWPRVADVLERGLPGNGVISELLGFTGFQLVRVPAFRDAIEQALERYARGQFNQLRKAGRLPEPPIEYPDLLDQVEITIDPHQSIHAMAQLLPKIGPVLERFGYSICNNRTPIKFISSDNPVSYFAKKADALIPYPLQVETPQQLLFPIGPETILIGSTDDRERYRRRGLKHVKLTDERLVRNFNHITAQFAYEVCFFQSAPPPSFMRRHAAASPVLAPSFLGFGPDAFVLPPFIFGTRKKMMKYAS